MATPQSGPVSAIGMAPETTAKYVPITGGSNPRTFGTASTNPARFFIVNPGSGIVPTAITQVPTEVDGNIERIRHFMTGATYQGEVSGFVDTEEIAYILMGVFGRCVQTTAQAADSTHSVAYKKVHTPNLKCPTFSVEEVFGDGTYGRLTSGVVVQSLTINLGDMLTWRAGLQGMRQVPNTFLSGGTETEYDYGSTAMTIPTDMGGDGSKTLIRTASPSYVTGAQGNHGNTQLAFAGQKYGAESGFSSAYVTIDGTGFTTNDFLPGGSITITREVEFGMAAGSGRNPEAFCTRSVSINGQLRFTFQDNTLPKALLGHKKGAVNAKWEGSQIGTSGVNYGLELHIPNARFNRSPVVAEAGCITVTADIDAIYDSTSAYGVKLTTWDSFNTASLGCVTGTYSGYLGGWVNS